MHSKQQNSCKEKSFENEHFFAYFLYTVVRRNDSFIYSTTSLHTNVEIALNDFIFRIRLRDKLFSTKFLLNKLEKSYMKYEMNV